MPELLSAPFIDTRADQLRFSLSAPRLDALASKRCGLVELRVLGASHQVIVHTPSPSTEPLIETVAYLPTIDEQLPASVERPGYQLRSRVHRLNEQSLQAYINTRLFALEHTPEALVARFPGHPYALTALTVLPHPDRFSWQTWHVYPQHGEIVETTSHLEPTKDRT